MSPALGTSSSPNNSSKSVIVSSPKSGTPLLENEPEANSPIINPGDVKTSRSGRVIRPLAQPICKLNILFVLFHLFLKCILLILYCSLSRREECNILCLVTHIKMPFSLFMFAITETVIKRHSELRIMAFNSSFRTLIYFGP